MRLVGTEGERGCGRVRPALPRSWWWSNKALSSLGWGLPNHYLSQESYVRLGTENKVWAESPTSHHCYRPPVPPVTTSRKICQFHYHYHPSTECLVQLARPGHCITEKICPLIPMEGWIMTEDILTFWSTGSIFTLFLHILVNYEL